MPVPTVCQDGRLRQFIEGLLQCFSKPQRKYFVTVLLGLMLCQESRTLSGLARQLADSPPLWGLSRFLSASPWSPTTLAKSWQEYFRTQLEPLVRAELAQRRAAQKKKRGRPKRPLVTGYLIGDDSTMSKRRGQKMAALGHHYSSTEGKPVTGHSLVMGLYVLLGRHCPLQPQLYRQQSVCEREGVAFQSKIALMVDLILTFVPVPGTTTHVLVDSWYAAKVIWQAARARGFLITTGLKANRAVRIDDPTAPTGWRWQRLSDYLEGVAQASYQKVWWPAQDGGRWVYVHILDTRVRKLYRCQVVMVRESLEAPLTQARFWASSELQADATTLVAHIAARWQVEVLFADTKELLGLDHYQLMSATAIVRFWTLVMAAYLFLDEERARLAASRHAHITLGEARREVQHRIQRNFLEWLFLQFQAGQPPLQVWHQLAA